MRLALTEDQELIAETARDFAKERSPVSRMRALRDAGDPQGYSEALWKEMAELGWQGIPYAEEHGGAGMGYAELVLVLEALGANLAPEPFLASVLLGGQTLLHGGSTEQCEAWLPSVVNGQKVVALAYQERNSRYDVYRIAATAEKTDNGFTLNGEKVHVLAGNAADALIVAARTSGSGSDADGISLFLVPADAAGLVREPQQRMDSQPAALIRLEGIELGADALIGREGQGGALLEKVVDLATVGLCAEMLGGMSAAFALTLDYLKEREQFGTRIGTFQALKHRAALIFIELELARSSVMAAARAIDSGSEDVQKLVSLAKARCSDAYVLAGNEGVQLFGGVGMTDEYDIGLYLKRARAAELTFGDAAWHRDRWARLSGY
jgi:alkylation response protein AidB-like acyl-CoA dehydrogenase